MHSKTAFITGASGGIGGAAAMMLAAKGYRLALCYNTNKQGVDALTQQLQAAGADMLWLQGDMASQQQATAMVGQATGHFGGVDLLVNNAGMAHFALFTDITLEDWRRVFAVNLDSAFYCTQAVLPYMIQQKQGAIINVSSIWGQVGASCEVAYSAAKAAMIGMTKALAKELAPSGIGVNCVAPGVIDTSMNHTLDDATIKQLKTEIPLGRLGTPEEIAHAIAFLATSPYITGQVLGVNGGLY